MVVDKNALMMRNGEGKLLPMDIHSDVFGGEVKIIPLKQGDFNDLKEKGANDDDIIERFLGEPKLTKEEITDLPMISKREMVKLILMSSGMTREEVDMTMRQGIAEMDDRIKKN